MDSSKHQGAFFFGVIVGAIAGALAALLMAPKSGRQIRHELKDQAGGVQQLITDATTNVRDRSEGLVGGYVDKMSRKAQHEQDAEDVVVETEQPAPAAPAEAETPVAADQAKEEPSAGAS